MLRTSGFMASQRANGTVRLPDAEILRIVSEVFEELGWTGRYTIKLNHRKILDRYGSA
jgi:histidyl-tRNA synthetase